MKNNLCISCDGRGFKWKKGAILSRKNGVTLANTYSQGDTCEACRGTGRCGLGFWAWTLIGLLALVLSVFLIQPALHLIFD